MYSVGIDTVIQNMLSLFYRLGIWYHGANTIRQTGTKLFYCIYNSIFPISLIAGAIRAENHDDAIFAVEVAILSGVLSIKLWFFVWKQDSVLALFNCVGVWSIKNHEDLALVNNKLKRFSRFATVVLILGNIAAIFASIIAPSLSSERKIFFKISFPLDWKNNDLAFWAVTVFILTQALLSTFTICFSTIIWYLMLNCALRYNILGNEIKTMGAIRTDEIVKGNVKRLNLENQKNVLGDLVAAIDSHQHIRRSTQELESFLTNIFFVQIVTSALCICGSTYCLGSNVGENLIERIIHVVSLFYNISEIFMITYLGQEIMLSSDRLSYCLFASDWVDQPQSIKKAIIIFGEILKQPHVIVIVIYPLTLDTFTQILNSVYSMFNILRNLI